MLQRELFVGLVFLPSDIKAPEAGQCPMFCPQILDFAHRRERHLLMVFRVEIWRRPSLVGHATEQRQPDERCALTSPTSRHTHLVLRRHLRLSRASCEYGVKSILSFDETLALRPP